MTTDKKNERAVSIYALVDPRTDEIRYIGRTSRRPGERLSMHLSCARRAHASALKVAWLEELAQAGLIPLIRVLAVTTPEQGPDEERRHIAMALAQGHTLVNIIYTSNRPCPATAGLAADSAVGAAVRALPAGRLPFHRYHRLEADGRIVALETPEPVRNRRVRPDGVMEVRMGLGPWCMGLVRNEMPMMPPS